MPMSKPTEHKSVQTRILKYAQEIGDYVIVHELLHFNVPNHGKLWKSLMTAYLGDYEKIEKKLNKEKLSLME